MADSPDSRDPGRRAQGTLRILTGVCVVLALMCAALAWAWNDQRAEAACWRAAVDYQLQPEGDCRGSSWARPAPKV
jgi:hypothetical protein